ncbi:MAG: hypothetical protein ACE5JQ_14970 [Candidatus Methylomirabilales bacterium]
MDKQAAWIRWGLLSASFLLATPGLGAAQTFTSGSTGADGPFNPTCTPTPCTVTVTLPPDGIFNFTTVNIPAGVTVRFTRNAANTPVILLATGNVTIIGTIDVSGGSGTAFGRPGPGGQGGFEGGAGADGITSAVGGFGLGPGGGGPANAQSAGGGGGGYLTAGTNGRRGFGITGTPGTGGPAYGSTALRPILGGSGGGGGGGSVGGSNGGGGGGGGGAIAIASSTRVTLNTTGLITIRANGGDGSFGSGGGGGGSGGAIRVIAPTISGVGQLRAEGGSGGNLGGQGANGRIRVEATTLTYNGFTRPLATSGFPQPVFPVAGQPTLTIASVGGVAAPASPSGSILAAPDILLPTGTTNPVVVTLTASNIPLGTTILVTATPQSGPPTSATSAGLTGTVASSTASASLTLSLTQPSVLVATATFPLVAAAGGGPIFAEGEEVKWVRVAATYGGGSTVTYITASGKEVRAEELR